MINEAGPRIGTALDTTRTAQEPADVGADRLVAVDLLSSALQKEPTDAIPLRGPVRRPWCDCHGGTWGISGDC